MKETLRALLKLAEIDGQIFQIQEEKLGIPTFIKEAQNEISSLKKEADDRQKELEGLSQKRKDAHDFINEKNEWSDKRETTINELKTHREYQAAQKEISLAKKEIKDKQTEIDQISPRIDELIKQISELKEKSEPRTEELKQQILQKNEKYEMADAHIKESQAKRKEIIAEIKDNNCLRHYENVRKKIFPAISKLIDNNCGECGQRVMPQAINLLKVGTEMQLCRGCKRILYIEELIAWSGKLLCNKR